MLNTILLPALLVILVLVGCSKSDPGTIEEKVSPWVITVAVKENSEAIFRVSGTVRARYETPVASMVKGRILARYVDTGQHVEVGQRLFSLDPRDLIETERVAEAQLAAAEAVLDTATRELERQQQLVEKKFTSQQAIEHFALAKRDAASESAAARARLNQFRNSREYAEIDAKTSGVLIEVNAEPGQVITVGEELALLAQDGNRDIELFLPDGRHPPQTGRIISDDGTNLEIELREIAGAADSASRSWRARYQVLDADASLQLGATVKIEFTGKHMGPETLTVPLGALDERGQGPIVWVINEGRAKSVPVKVITLAQEEAKITADLLPGSKIIALGTHLLTPGMTVRARE